MPHVFPSQAWGDAFKDALNQNPEYAAAGREWTHGSVAMVVRADPALDLDEDMALLLDVHAGECRAATYMRGEQARRAAAFVIEGLYAQWVDLIEHGRDPIKTLMQGKLKMTKGRLPTMLRYVASSKQLLLSAQRVDSAYRGNR